MRARVATPRRPRHAGELGRARHWARRRPYPSLKEAADSRSTRPVERGHSDPIVRRSARAQPCGRSELCATVCRRLRAPSRPARDRRDPIPDRGHLLANLFTRAWSAGEGLDLGALIAQIQKPPLTRVGAMDLEAFYPAKEREQLAVKMNNLLASPGFNAWLEGVPLDIGQLLRSESGKPRVAIVSIAHLSEAERMFFVSLLLNQVLDWVRAQSGTTSLRAILYMDEIFGYFPPVAEPPSKRPLLTLLKQARAFGLGIMLTTQNPVDLDYKGPRCGTWFLGRLQTSAQGARAEGLEALGRAHGRRQGHLDAWFGTLERSS